MTLEFASWLRGLVALPLALALIAPQSSAQKSSSPAAERATPDAESAGPEGNSAEALVTASRNILELLEVHRFRLERIDMALVYYRGQSDVDRVRQFQLLREREQTGYQQTLETYRRLLGEQDFARVAGLLRKHLNEAREGQRGRENPATQVSASERAERVRRTIATQAAEQRERAAQQAAQERSLAIERSRASQRAQLAQRLEAARAQQLALRAEQERRYQPSSRSSGEQSPFRGERPVATSRPGAQAPETRPGGPPPSAGRSTPPASRAPASSPRGRP